MKIYSVKISNVSQYELNKLCFLIDLEKKFKIKKFINQKDKIRTLIGEILIRTIIVEKLKIDNKCIRFSKNEYGKPYLKDYPNFNFNISHSGEYVLCVVDNKPVGIDIEEIKYIEYEEIAKRFFTAREFDYIVNQELCFQLNSFYEIWTLKESYIKCLGQGLSIPLKSFSIELEKYENMKMLINTKYKEYTLKLFDINLGYKIAVCSLNKKISNNIIQVDQNSLVSKFYRFNFD
ncbi:4'-phosphopantetheinyl transferase family protein [Clostridium beijerinckii]|uniref:4'-phosphopantetheinyl transferase n=1 Tax=Clostridium beijerinckii TaxID=1520 RepID=A0A9Q5CUS4_CLOBE|nr:4'-phosphopantetheinyl transferase superfamily protein [Clostridium beijerinckii]AQS04673.1 4'-phosphopantetheinyl transferase sfp [Clostridium beijerinckii]MBA2886878.1 4'-phosphopantetheinyl transferase [Clostridium beijerinckii]MBA2901895.1 4'-phosphopantetheinyl transferase [Clostridium beijerinckii]MBA2911593.1 4'-phosphopantetheinyl transferase [Clostridium beijerinckii]MBA9015769.1 4'-phosphopantetheinyl transferase [Clostridium beijerinckii]